MSERRSVRFGDGGQLEPGVYPLAPQEIVALFGQATARREQLGRIFTEIVARMRETGIVHRCWIGGSFPSTKPYPGDIDIWILVADGSDHVTMSALFADLFEHERAKLVYGADIFWMTESGAALMLEKVLDCLQTSRDGIMQGIVEVVL